MNSFVYRPELIGYEKAIELALGNVSPLSKELCSCSEALGRVSWSAVRANNNLPSADSSLKDGYAVKSSDLKTANDSAPVFLKLVGNSITGHKPIIEVKSGTAIRILSGAVIPEGADAVLAEEFTESYSDMVKATADAHFGRNILKTGADILKGQVLVEAGELITPAKVGLLVAGGVTDLYVSRMPSVGLLATGDEVILPGRPLPEGKLYSSNVALQEAWLKSMGIKCLTEACGDSIHALIDHIDRMLLSQDILITSGGAWTGDRDLVIKALDHLNWNPLFHRVRMGPGKAVGMGLLRGKPVFCLPGGPPSNEMAFLMIALPAIAKILGRQNHFMPTFMGTLTEELIDQIDWTQFVHCDLSIVDGEYWLKPLEMRTRRLSAMGKTKAIVKIPEGVDKLAAGTRVSFYAYGMDFS